MIIIILLWLMFCSKQTDVTLNEPHTYLQVIKHHKKTRYMLLHQDSINILFYKINFKLHRNKIKNLSFLSWNILFSELIIIIFSIHYFTWIKFLILTKVIYTNQLLISISVKFSTPGLSYTDKSWICLLYTSRCV